MSRLEYGKVSPGVWKAMRGLGDYNGSSSIEEKLGHLVRLRASQINGCAYCIDMHSKDLLALGESVQRIYSLQAWAESPFYTFREKAALEWTEAVTNLRHGHVSDEVYGRASKAFTQKELVDLTMILVEINGWNRLSIAFRTDPGKYQPKTSKS
jgi:AhpD family alkylhydroperoxidase